MYEHTYNAILNSGSPFPEQECNAADAVMQFAINRLGYKPENIIVMGG